MITRIVRAAVLGMFVAQALVAQTRTPPIYRNVPPSMTATIVGHVLDAETGQPIAGALISAQWPARQGRESVKLDGTFRLDMVEPGMVTINVNCPSRTMLGAHVRDTVVRADSGKVTSIVLRIERDACREPTPGDRTVGVRGVVTSGFEDFSFRPCADTTAEFKDLWGPAHLRQAWLSMSPTAQARLATDTAGTRDGYGSVVRYVEGTGVLHGPGSYGHMGVSPYLLEIRSVRIVLASPPPGCQVVDRRTVF